MSLRWIAAALALAMGAGLSAQTTVVVNAPLVAQARAEGQVGERFDGYLGLVGPASETVRKQVGAVNIKRRALYSGLAAKRGVTPQEVALTAACRLMETVAVGEYFMADDGRWQRRGAGDPAPVPAYCGG